MNYIQRLSIRLAVYIIIKDLCMKSGSGFRNIKMVHSL